MTENFIRAFDALEGESIMGTQLVEIYGDAVHSEAISQLPQRVDTITVAGKEYQASYYGEKSIADASELFRTWELWRLEGAFEDFSACPAWEALHHSV